MTWYRQGEQLSDHYGCCMCFQRLCVVIENVLKSSLQNKIVAFYWLGIVGVAILR